MGPSPTFRRPTPATSPRQGRRATYSWPSSCYSSAVLPRISSANLLPVLGLLFAAGVPVCGAAFRASAVEVDITPDTPQWLMGYNARQSTGVHDKIYHRIVALDDGTTQFYLVSSDLCLFSPSVYDEAAERLSKELGIPRGHVWWSVTHSHATPELGAPGIYKSLLGRSDHEWNRDYAAKVIDAL